MNNKKKWILLTTVTILLMIIIVFLIGRSFGFFKYIKEGEIVNIITINGIKVDVVNEDADALNLQNTYPMADSEGLTLTPFVFSVTNTSDRNLTYSIKVETDTEKLSACTLEDGTACPELSTNYIKYSYKKNDGTYTEPAILSETDNVIATGTIAGKETIISSVILWIDSEAGNEIQGHYFYGKLVITGEQYAEKRLNKIILSANSLIETEPTLTTSSNNTSDASGLYKSTATNDGSPTYYFRGNVENNYVSFAGFTWRIIRINEDGTIRIILDNGINNNKTYAYNSNYDDPIYMYYSNSDAKIELENWYIDNIVNNGYDSKVASGNYFCEQAKVVLNNNYAINSGASMSVYSSYTPEFKCATDANGKGLVNTSIGLVTYDEAVFAGGYLYQVNSNYYLFNDSTYWMMSPAGFYDNSSVNWFVLSTGRISNGISSTGLNLRAVLNLNSNAMISSGTGTSTDPYVIKV